MRTYRPLIAALVAALLLARAATAAPVRAIGIESQYADIIRQIGGPAVTVTAIETDPNTDPHEFEISPRIAAALAGANLVVENGLGYDDWAEKMLAAAANPARQTIDVRQILNLSATTANPHLWYDIAAMPAIADAIAASLAKLDPANAKIYLANAAKFQTSLSPIRAAIAGIGAQFPGAKIAVTEPVGDALLAASGADIATPWTLQAAIMNGTDAAPQDITTENAMLTTHTARVLIYNAQVTSPLTESFLVLARQNQIPVVGVYEIMPTGYSYQSWMAAELTAIRAALTTGKSTPSLLPAP